MLLYIIFGLVLGSIAQSPTLSELEEKLNDLEAKITVIQNQLEHGGKKYQTLQYTTSK